MLRSAPSRGAYAIARMLALWPRVAEMYPDLAMARHGEGRQHRTKSLGNHEFRWCGKLWVCVRCLRYKKGASSKVDASVCVTVPSHISKLVQDPLGHSLFLTRVHKTGCLGVFCKRCGFFSFTNTMGLRAPCLQKGEGMSKGTSYRLGRICRGSTFWGITSAPSP